MSDEEDTEGKEEKKGLAKATKEVLSGLTAKEAKVLKEKFGIDLSTDYTLEEIAKQFDVTRERIRQIEEKALKKLRNKNKGNQPRCSFCGKSKEEVDRLIASQISAAFICWECIKTSTDLLDE